MSTGRKCSLAPCFVKAKKSAGPCPTASPRHAVLSSASRERTALVWRRHRELGVLIKFFYNSACAVHLRDKGLERRGEDGGGRWILKQLPVLKQNPNLTRWSTLRRNVQTPPLCKTVSVTFSVCACTYIQFPYLHFRLERAARKQFDIVAERQYTARGGRAPCEEIWWVSNPDIQPITM